MPGQFTFTPHMPKLADWAYRFDNEVHTDLPDGITITVVGHTADGVRSTEGGYLFFVNS